GECTISLLITFAILFQLIKAEIHAKVLVKFEIEKDGSVGRLFNLKKVYIDLDNEFIANIKKMSGKWNPRKIRG
ncbi:MAG: hypothetical protein ACI97P_002471, partial [Arcticibacterium sp.]